MNLIGTSKIAAAAMLAAGVLMSSGAGAAPAASTQALATQEEPTVQPVRDGWRRGGWRGHRHRGGGWGWGAAAATGLLLTAPYAYGAYDDGYDGDDDGYAYRGDYAGGGVARCEATFRSFDPASGTYMGYDGVRRVCPYL